MTCLPFKTTTHKRKKFCLWNKQLDDQQNKIGKNFPQIEKSCNNHLNYVDQA